MPSRAAAQSCAPTEATCAVGQIPHVFITPAQQTWTGTTQSTSLAVTVQWCSPYMPLDQTSIVLTLGGADVRSAFTYQAGTTQFVSSVNCRYYATSTGSVTVKTGTPVSLYASIADGRDSVGSQEAGYTYTYQPPPAQVARGVSVTPDNGSAIHVSHQSATEVFTVTNTGNVTSTYYLDSSCPGVATYCWPAQRWISVAPGGSASVGVNYYLSSDVVGSAGRVRLTAIDSVGAQTDSGTVQTTLVPAAAGGYAGSSYVGEPDPTGFVTQSRALCLMLPAGPGEYECGDLRLAHGMPATTVLGRTFAPTLLYSTANARPTPIVSAFVSPPAGRGTPQTVNVTLWVDGGVVYTQSLAGWPAGEARRVGGAFDARGMGTGIRQIRLQATAVYSDGSTSTIYDQNGYVPIVDRTKSPFGNGWWLAGLESLVPISDGTLLWVGGDGSTARYRPTGSGGVYVADAFGGPDTLVAYPTNPDSMHYQRRLQGGGGVWFDGSGRHRQTINRLGQRSRFEWSNNRLVKIWLPETDQFSTHQAYTFTYATAGQLLSAIDAPNGEGARTVTVTDSAGYVTFIRDPDLKGEHFAYASGMGIVTNQQDRAGTWTDWWFGAGVRLTGTVQHNGSTSYITQYSPQEALPLSGPAPVASVYTLYDGPRTDVQDVAYFWTNRLSVPYLMRDALGHDTQVIRADSRFPVLPTHVVHANGHELSTGYNASGEAVATVDWSTANPATGEYATTLYDWDPVWHEVTRVTLPGGETTLRGYDAYGRLAWAQAGTDSVRRTRFTYFAPTDGAAPGLLQSVQEPLTRASTFQYDFRGNLHASIDPAGLTTTTTSDSIGRAKSVLAPTGALKELTYDALDAVVEEHSYGPSRQGHTTTGDTLWAAENLWVHTYRNAREQPDSVSRWQSPDPAAIGKIITRWHYDALGRTVAEIAPDSTDATVADNPRDSTVYDPAGHATDVFTRLGFHLTMQYDALGRLARRITPADTVVIPYSAIQFASPDTTYFPFYAQDAERNFTLAQQHAVGSVIIPADTATFQYDVAGNLTEADNHDARVTRTWNVNGTLASETQAIRTYSGANFATHVYRIDYGYDLEGRRTSMTHPAAIAPVGPGAVTHYGYDRVTGDLAWIQGAGGYSFDEDAAGRTVAVRRGTTAERFIFDDTGRLQVRMDSTGDRQVHYDVTHYDPATGEVYEVDALQERVLQARRPLGALGWVSTYHDVKGATSVEQYGTDPLANQVYWRSLSYAATTAEAPPSEPEDAVNNYQAHTGRLMSAATSSAPNAPYERSFYDRAGNQTYRFSFKPVSTIYTDPNGNKIVAQLRDESGLYYGADDKLHVADRRTCLYFPTTQTLYTCDPTRPPTYENRAAFEEYRYDALGRRVLVRTRSEYDCQLNCLSTLRRMVWDGDQLLYEISAPGASGTTATQMEADTGLAVPFFLNAQHTAVAGWFPYGRVMYEHGGGIDAPLGVVRMEFSDVLHDPQVIFPFHTWRGSYDGGVTQGQCAYYTTNGTQLAPAPDSTPTEGDTQYRVHANSGYGSTAEHCVTVDWPAAFMLSARQLRRGYAGPDSWMGSLLFESRDASGLYYRRNRYYDAEKQRFTQEDPIGIAGGINVYGFAGGDPIRYSDPYGLCPIPLSDCPPGFFTVRFAAAGATAGAAIGAGAGVVAAAPTAELASPLTVVTGAVGGAWAGAKAGLLVGSAVDAGVALTPLINRVAEHAQPVIQSLRDTIRKWGVRAGWVIGSAATQGETQKAKVEQEVRVEQTTKDRRSDEKSGGGD